MKRRHWFLPLSLFLNIGDKMKDKIKKIFGSKVIVVAALCILAAVIAVAIWNSSDTGEDSRSSPLEGVWVYDESTKYEFDKDGRGAMFIGKTEYSYSFKIKGSKLRIDFDNDAVHDATYDFSVKGDKLTLVGGEGTIGGEYELTKES